MLFRLEPMDMYFNPRILYGGRLQLNLIIFRQKEQDKNLFFLFLGSVKGYC